jgi:hypothetical protein
MDDNEIEQRELLVKVSKTTCTVDCEPEYDTHCEECIKNAFAYGNQEKAKAKDFTPFDKEQNANINSMLHAIHNWWRWNDLEALRHLLAASQTFNKSIMQKTNSEIDTRSILEQIGDTKKLLNTLKINDVPTEELVPILSDLTGVVEILCQRLARSEVLKIDMKRKEIKKAQEALNVKQEEKQKTTNEKDSKKRVRKAAKTSAHAKMLLQVHQLTNKPMSELEDLNMESLKKILAEWMG